MDKNCRETPQDGSTDHVVLDIRVLDIRFWTFVALYNYPLEVFHILLSLDCI